MDQGKEQEGSEGREETGRRRETTDTGLLKLLQNELLVFILPSPMVSSLLENTHFNGLRASGK